MRIILLSLLLLTAHHAWAGGAYGDDSCLEISLTGTMGGPPQVGGLAGAGTLVRYGQSSTNCNEVLLQFDAGRGTTQRLSELGVSPLQLDAVFITHMHSDHTEGLAGIMQYRCSASMAELGAGKETRFMATTASAATWH